MLLNSVMRWTLVLLSAAFLAACSMEGPSPGKPSAGATMDVYKSPTCGCCVDWITHIEDNGFSARTYHPQDLDKLKADKGIARHYQSCHTGITENGYVFEGHVPARYIQQFLADTPEGAIGLSVPGMPVGSPGMEIGDRFTPYQVLLLKTDGNAEVYATIESPADQ